MKPKRKVRTTKKSATLSAIQSLPGTATPLEQVIPKFIKAKAPFCGKRHLSLICHVLIERLTALGKFPIGAVTPQELDNIVYGGDLKPTSQHLFVTVFKSFFTWSRAQGYLPPGQPTPADPLRFPVPKFLPPPPGC